MDHQHALAWLLRRLLETAAVDRSADREKILNRASSDLPTVENLA